jgi:hypothetical protein
MVSICKFANFIEFYEYFFIYHLFLSTLSETYKILHFPFAQIKS